MSPAYVAMELWLSTSNCWIRVPHSSRLEPALVDPERQTPQPLDQLVETVDDLGSSSTACPAIELMISVSAPAIKAMPPSRVTAADRPRLRSHRCSRFATGLSMAASRIATATGITTSDRKPRILPTK